MKNRNFLKTSISLLLPISLSVGALFAAPSKTSEGSAYTKNGSLATTINLKDNTEQEIKDYYADLNGLSSTQLQGNNLLKNLKPILMDGQKYFAYDSSGDDLWKMYEIIDRDWEKSPASAITGYNPSTNTITGYKYGTSTSNKGTNPYIHALYVDRNVENETRAWDDHQQSQWGINREHIWPKSQGFDTTGAGGARGDPMHLWAGNGRVNGTEHNNNMYGFVDKSKTYTNPYAKLGYKNLKDNYSGKSLTVPTSTDTVFEPQDSDKGDIARACFYMVARYNNIAGNDSTIDANNPNLSLQQTTKNLPSYTTTSSNKQTGYMGLMTDLLYWNHLDPVDEFEIHRNNLLFNNYTYNRNPFIDYPEWADYIWGKPVYNGRNYVSYNSTPTGSVNLSTDVINGFKGEQPAQTTVTSIEVTTKPTKLVYNVGDTIDTTGMVVKARMSNNTTKTLSASEYTVSPSGTLKATDTQVTVSYQGKSDSFEIAVKNSGGSQTQTVTYTLTINSTIFPSTITGNSYVNYNGTYTVTAISESEKTKDVSVVTSQVLRATGDNANKFQFKANTGQISGTIDGATILDITSDINTLTLTTEGNSFSAKNTTSNAIYAGYVKVTFTIEESGGDPISDVDVSSITLNKNNVTLEMGASDSLSATVFPSNATIKLVSWSSSNSSVVEVSDTGEITAKSPGNATISCTALDGSGVTATCSVTVNEPVTLTSISLSGEHPTEFYVGDQFSLDGLIVTANYSDNTHADVTDDVEITGYDMSVQGTQIVTVEYGDKTATYSIQVKAKTLAANEILFVASQQGLVNSDDLTSYTDSVATLTFTKNSGSQPKYYSSTSAFRVYAKNTFTISGTKKITKIEFEMAATDTVGSNTISASAGTLSGNIWTGNESSVVFSVAGTSGQRNIVSIKVTYDENSEEILALSSISLSGTYKTEFNKGETFTSDGLVVTAHYSNGTEAVVTDVTITPPTMTTVGNKPVSVSYTENNITKTATYNINIVSIVATSIELTGNYKTEYKVGDTFSTSGMTVVEHFSDGHTANHNPSSCTITTPDMSTPGRKTISVTYGEISTSYNIIVSGVTNAKYTFSNESEKAVSINDTDIPVSKFLSLAESDSDNVIIGYKNASYSYIGGNGGSGDSTWNIWNCLKVGKSNYQGMITLELDDIYTFGSIKVNAIGARDDGTLTINGITKDVTKKATKGNLTPIELIYPISGPLSELTLSSKNATKDNYGICITSIQFCEEEVAPVEEKELTGISVSRQKSSFTVGDEFSFGGTVTATYSDDSTEDVTASATFTGYDLSTAGNQTVTVTYNQKTTNYGITVSQSVAPTEGSKKYLKVTSLSDIDSSSRYIIGFESENTLISIPNNLTGSSTFSGISLDISDGIVTDSDDQCALNLTDVSDISNNSLTAKIKIGAKYLNSSASSSFSLATQGTNWTFSVENDLFRIVNGDRGVIYRTSTFNKFGNYSKSNVNNTEYCLVSLYKEIPVSQGFSIVNDASDLNDGDTIIFIGSQKETGKNTYKYYSLSTNRNLTSDIEATEIDYVDSQFMVNENTELITVVKQNGVISFKTSDGKFLTPKSSNNAGLNLADSNTSDEAKWTIEIDDSVATVSSNSSLTTYKNLRFNYNNGDPKFKCYMTGGTSISIAKYTPQVEADTWSKSFISSTQGCSLGEWNNLASSFSLLSKAAKDEICNVIANQSTDASYRAQAMARYEYILSDSRYSSATAFITDRGVAPSRPVVLPTVLPDKSTVLIIVFALVGVTAIGSYCFVKRKKERA